MINSHWNSVTELCSLESFKLKPFAVCMSLAEETVKCVYRFTRKLSFTACNRHPATLQIRRHDRAPIEQIHLMSKKKSYHGKPHTLCVIHSVYNTHFSVAHSTCPSLSAVRRTQAQSNEQVRSTSSPLSTAALFIWPINLSEFIRYLFVLIVCLCLFVLSVLFAWS